MTNIKTKYLKEIVPELKKSFGFKNDFMVPKLEKIKINVGISKKETEHNSKYLEIVEGTITQISGQKPVQNLAKKSIAGFKIREGIPVGVSVTLRGKRMYDFLEKVINIVLPRIRDFRGLNEKSIDHNGNLSIGFKEQTVFPEIDQEKIEKVHGLQITFTVKSANREQGLALFKLLGFPFRKIIIN